MNLYKFRNGIYNKSQVVLNDFGKIAYEGFKGAGREVSPAQWQRFGENFPVHSSCCKICNN